MSTTFQQKVSTAVRQRLDRFPWFRGVCMDGVGDFERLNDLDGAIEHATNNTLYWDCPAHSMG